jgi:predicted dehydrogenase
MDDSTLMLLDFGEAVFAEVNGTFCRRAANSFQIELYGERGVAQLGGWMRLDVPLEVHTDGSFPDFPQGWYQPQGLKPQLKHTIADLAHFADCIRDGLTPLNGAAHAAHVIEVIEEAYLAARTGQTQTVHSEF